MPQPGATPLPSEADRIIDAERRRARSRWYRSRWLHPEAWLHPELMALAPGERQALLAQAREQSRRGFERALLAVWFALCTAVWIVASSTGGHRPWAAMLWWPLPVVMAVVRAVRLHRAVGRLLAMRAAAADAAAGAR